MEVVAETRAAAAWVATALAAATFREAPVNSDLVPLGVAGRLVVALLGPAVPEDLPAWEAVVVGAAEAASVAAAVAVDEAVVAVGGSENF